MKPFPGSIRVQEIYEALVSFKMEYPYKIVTENDKVEFKTELFPENEEEEFVTEAKKIEVGTTYKLRPVIIMSKSEKSSERFDDVFLAIPLTKKKETLSKKEQTYILEVCKNTLKERHFLFKQNYVGALRFDSFVLIDNIQPLTKNNIYRLKGRLKDGDYQVVQAKLKNVLFPNPAP